MGADFPLAFAEDFQAGGVEEEMAARLGLGIEVELEVASAARPHRVMRRSPFKVEQPEERSEQTLSLRQGPMEDLAYSQTAEDGGVGLLAGPAATDRVAEIEPEVASRLVKAEGEASAMGERLVIGFPVTGAVLGFGFLVFHT